MLIYNVEIENPFKNILKNGSKICLILESIVAIKIPFKNTSNNEKQNFIVY